jgi:RNA polymerase sigma-70 factor (ECF subfamily)
VDDWPDERLLAATAREPQAFGVFYRRHETAVLGYFMRRTGDPELTADPTAETFAAALVGARHFQERDGEALAWLSGIARRRLLRSLERGRVEERARRKLGMPKLVLDDELIERIAELDGDEWVASLLAQLPDDQAAAVEARILEQLPYDEIASRLRCSQAVVRKRVSRGLTTLRGGRTSALADGWASVARAAQENDIERLRAEQRLNCREVGAR